jgi:O-antigen ligase
LKSMSISKSDIQNRVFLRNILFIVGICVGSILSAFLFAAGYGLYGISTIIGVAILILCFRDFRLLVVLAMIAGANLGLISNRIAIKLPNGNSLFELRDVFLVLILVIGLIKGHRYLIELIKTPFVISGLLIVSLVPMAVVVGILNKGETIEIAREAYTLGLWILPWVIAANIRDKQSIVILIKWILVVGSLVALGAVAEVLSGNALRLVSNVYTPGIGGLIQRAIPDGNVYFTLTSALAMAFLIRKDRIPGLPIWVMYVICILMLGTSFLILMRTTIVTFVITALILVIFNLFNFKRTNITKILLIFLLGGIILIMIFNYFVRVGGQYWTQVTMNRFLTTISGISNNGRIYEMGYVFRILSSSPFWGVGLGAPYRDLYLGEAINPNLYLVHDIYGFFLVKMGLPGLLVFLNFNIAAIRSFFFNIKRKSSDSTIGLALSIGIIGMLIQAIAGNVFGSIQGLPIAMVVVGLLISYSRLQEQADDVS